MTIRQCFAIQSAPRSEDQRSKGALNFDLRFLSGVLIAANLLGNPVLLCPSIGAPSEMLAHIVQPNDNLPGVVATVLALPRPVHSVVLFVRPTLLSVSSQPKAPQRYRRAEDMIASHPMRGRREMARHYGRHAAGCSVGALANLMAWSWSAPNRLHQNRAPPKACCRNDGRARTACAPCHRQNLREA